MPSKTRRRSRSDSRYKTPAGRDVPVVGVGSSAGGLTALKRFIEAVPEDSGMAFVLIQHLSPDHASLTAQLLAPHTSLPVTEVTEDLPIEPDHIYVIPPNAFLELRDGMLSLTEPMLDRGLRLPVDHFFRSLAEARGEAAVGVLLSGTGSDGTLGLEAIKSHDGLTLAQDPNTAQFDGMVRSAMNAGLVDLILEAERLPGAVVGYFRHEPANRGTALTGRTRDVNRILQRVEAGTGRDFRDYKRGTLNRRIERRMALHHTDTVDAYVALLDAHPEEVQALCADFLISVTGFFRDEDAFRVLREQVVVPRVRDCDEDVPIRVWVPACASGEEAYSIAMLFAEVSASEGRTCPVRIFATDINLPALEHARSGVYSPGIAADVGPERLARFFEHEGGRYRIRKSIREMITFAPQDLTKDPPYSNLDLISCRNLLIYLNPALQQRMLALFHLALTRSGHLFLGGSETIGSSDLFESIDRKARLYRKQPLARPRLTDLPPGIVARPGVEAVAPPRTRVARPRVQRLPEQIQRHILATFTPAVILVDRLGRIRYSHGPVDRYLLRPSGVPTDDLLAQSREGLRRILRSALRRFAEAEEPVVREEYEGVATLRAENGAVRQVRVRAEPFVAVDTEETLLLVAIEELPTEAGVSPGLLPADSVETALVEELEQELRFAREEQQRHTEELASANEELKAANEEVLSMNEELQSTNEELETAKEELQSMNEELASVNLMLENRLEELEAANNDLTNLLATTDLAVLFLDADGRIQRFTPATEALFNLIPTDVGRPLADIAHPFRDGSLHPDIERVMRENVASEEEVITRDGRWFVQRLRPYVTRAGEVRGVVVTYVDVTRLKSAERADRRLAAFMRDANDAVVVMDRDGVIQDWNRGAERLYGWKREAMLGASIRRMVPDDVWEETRALLAGLSEGRSVPSFQTRRLTRDGRTLDVWLTATALDRDEGPVIATTERDVTQRERELAAARDAAEQLNAQKTLFMASANHDLRQPLQTLRLLNATLSESLDDTAALGLLAQQARNLETMQALLDTLLDVTRLELGQVTPHWSAFSAAELCLSLGDHFGAQAREKGLQLRIVPCNRLIRSDRQLLRSILHNLVSNAIAHAEAGKVLVGCRRRGGDLRIEVWDTGPGIPESEVEAIFTDFRQLSNPARERGKGTGLGLPLTRRMAELLGHPLEVRSVPGRGSMFAVSVPLADGAESDHAEPSVPTPLPRSTSVATILLVEDDPDVAAALAMLWDVVGFAHVAVARGNEAIERVEAKAVVPDIVICDYRLPGEMNGMEVIQAVRGRLGRPIPGVLLTGDTTSIRPEDVAAEDCVLVYKPADPAALVRLIEDLLQTGDGQR